MLPNVESTYVALGAAIEGLAAGIYMAGDYSTYF